MRISPSNDPPKRLSAEAKRWWRLLAAEYRLDDPGGLLLLQTALESFDRMRQAQAAIKRDGATLMSSKGELKSHPLLTVERDNRGQMMMALKSLNLDLEPLREAPGRPPGR